MTLSEFISRFDYANSVVLLEGKRNVLPADAEKLTALGRLLATNTRLMTFRSGNAAGADQLFSEGVTAVNPERLQVVTPYSGHRKKTNVAFQTYSLEDMNLAEEPEVGYHSRGNKKMEKLIDQYRRRPEPVCNESCLYPARYGQGSWCAWNQSGQHWYLLRRSV
ncbi:MAG: hypothetical protein LW693_10485 [Saprospiraceae bacterium]|nr:hypothetical protein [Saprospiraceae bacterium]